MGVIKRQGIKQSFVRYIGIAFGVLNLLIFYPLYLGDEKLGEINFVVNTAMLASSFVLLGANMVAVRFFPVFKDKDTNHNGFLSFLLIWTGIGFLIFLLVVFMLQPYIINYYGQKSEVYLELLPFVIPIVLLIALSTILQKHANNFNRIVIPTIFNQFYKIILPFLAFLFFMNFIPFTYIIYGIIGYYFLMVIGLICYLKYLGEWSLDVDFSFLDKPILKDIFTYAGYGILGSFGGILAVKIDSFMVASLIDFSNTGIYTVAIFIAAVIRVPSEAIIAISTPILATALTHNDMEEVTKIYKKSSIILWTVGLFFLIGIWINLDSLFAIMPRGETFAQGKLVVLILGLGILFDLLTSVNGEIIALSKYFRFNFYALFFLAILNIATNLIFIPRFGINGAAMATAFSLFLFNLIKLIFVYYKFNIQPFTNKTLLVFFIAVITYVIAALVPPLWHPIIDIAVRSIIIGLIFIPCIIYFKISEDINTSFWQLIAKFRDKK